MALTYTATVFNASGTSVPGNGSYKDVTDAGVANGDLLVCLSAGEGYTFSGGTRSIATQAGATGSWTTYYPTPTLNNDTEVVAGWATASGSGSVTVRPVVRTTAGSFGWTGSVLVRIPAAEWTGTPAGVAAFQADADGQVSCTLAAGTWTVIYIGADWSAGAPGSSNTPAGATNQTTFTDASHYAVAIRTWTGQAAGTRSYGPTGLSGRDYTGVVIAVQEASAGSNDGTLVAALPVATASITGSSTNAGSLSASLPRATAAMSGNSTNAGALSSSLPRATATVTGTSTNSGTLSVSIVGTTATLTGSSTNAGALSASLPRATASIAGQATNPGALTAALPLITAVIADTATNTGAISASLPKITATITGSSTNVGALAASLPKATGQISGTSTNTGTLQASLSLAAGQIAGSSMNAGMLTTALPLVTASITEGQLPLTDPVPRYMSVTGSPRTGSAAISTRVLSETSTGRTATSTTTNRTMTVEDS